MVRRISMYPYHVFSVYNNLLILSLKPKSKYLNFSSVALHLIKSFFYKILKPIYFRDVFFVLRTLRIVDYYVSVGVSLASTQKLGLHLCLH
jgi:hypothetical protein